MIQKIIAIVDATCKVPNAHIKGRAGWGRAAAGFVILDEGDNILQQGAKYLGERTVPQAEMEGLIEVLENAAAYCRYNVEVRTDSELCVRWMNGIYRLKKPKIRLLFDKVKDKERRFAGTVSYIWHSRNSFWGKYVDNLADKEYQKIQI